MKIFQNLLGQSENEPAYFKSLKLKGEIFLNVSGAKRNDQRYV